MFPYRPLSPVYNGFCDFLRLFLSHKLRDQAESKRNRSSKAAAGSHISVHNNRILTGFSSVKLIHKRRIGGRLSVFQKSQLCKNTWGCADGCNLSAFCIILCEKACKGLMLTQIFCSRHSSRKYQHICI